MFSQPMTQMPAQGTMFSQPMTQMRQQGAAAATDPQSDYVAVMLPADKVARVIGKGGAGLQQVRTSSGCKLTMASGPDAAGQRRLDIAGSPDQIGAAFGQVAQRAFSDDPDFTANLQVAAEKAGQIVGKAAANLQKVRQMCGVNIQVERNPVMDPTTGAQERTFTMKGNAGSMGPALSLALGGGGGMAAMGGGMMSGVGGIQKRSASQAGMQDMGMMMGMMGGKKARAAGNDETKILVPGGMAGAVIGKQAAGLKMLRETYGCRVEVLSKDECCGRFPEDRVVMVSGPMAARQAAVCAILQLVYPDGNGMQFKTVMSNGRAGAVIGKGGQTLKGLREQTGVAVQVEKTAMDGERVVRTSHQVAHNSAQVLSVAKLIMQASEVSNNV